MIRAFGLIQQTKYVEMKLKTSYLPVAGSKSYKHVEMCP